MGKREESKLALSSDVRCLENLVVAYNTVFLMSSIFVVSIASTAQHWFSDFNTLLSPTVLLLLVSGFIVLLGTVGYIGIAKRSSTIISMYTLLLIFVFVLEISAGLGVLSFRREIKSVVSHKLKESIGAYPDDPLTANLIDYVQLELRCCGVDNYWDWDDVPVNPNATTCRVMDLALPQSCCRKVENSTYPIVNSKGCLPALNFMFHSSALFLSASLIAICTLQILGAYFSYSLSIALQKSKLEAFQEQQNAQNAQNAPPPPYERCQIPVNPSEKTNYF